MVSVPSVRVGYLPAATSIDGQAVNGLGASPSTARRRGDARGDDGVGCDAVRGVERTRPVQTSHRSQRTAQHAHALRQRSRSAIIRTAVDRAAADARLLSIVVHYHMLYIYIELYRFHE